MAWRRILLAMLMLVGVCELGHAQRGRGFYENNYANVDRRDPRYRPHPSGGRTADFAAKYSALAASGAKWRITSDCASACTMGFGYFPKSRVCISRNVKLGFHQGNNASATAALWQSYTDEIRSMIDARGGLRLEWLWIPAREFHRLGYPVC
ncbi:MAG: hypothetical protein J0H62_05390 [Rhizobiales bacterium]|nr:hypothetical protein [Hyphomicrobiales bacterium]